MPANLLDYFEFTFALVIVFWLTNDNDKLTLKIIKTAIAEISNAPDYNII